MNRYIWVVGVAATVIAGLVIATNFVTLSLGQHGSDHITLDSDTASAVEAHINIPSGDLNIQSGAEALLVGDFTYKLPAWNATATYQVNSEKKGILTVEQPSKEGNPLSDAGYQYDLQFNNSIPLELFVQHSLGDSSLALGGLSLSRLEAHLGNGDALVNLNSNYPTLTEVSIITGQGADHITLECECLSLQTLLLNLNSEADTVQIKGSYPVLASLNMDSSLGGDQLSLDGDYPTLSSITLNLGSGDDIVNLAGNYPSLLSFIINVGTGDDVIDLNHAWQHDVHLTIISESDSTTLKLPQDVGVYIQIAGHSSAVQKDGLQREGEAYVNAAYGSSPVTLYINLNTSAVETVNLSLGE